ncbi:MAG: hypothetical protein DBY36_04205 [Clostridiales bacterium]|nr:MAG: hypothetical protein DBY36_04205 [Clostridiales bacterium]
MLAKVEFLRRQSESFTIACIKSVENYSTDAQRKQAPGREGTEKRFFRFRRFRPAPASPRQSTDARLAAAFAVSGPLLPLRRPA